MRDRAAWRASWLFNFVPGRRYLTSWSTRRLWNTGPILIYRAIRTSRSTLCSGPGRSLPIEAFSSLMAGRTARASTKQNVAPTAALGVGKKIKNGRRGSARSASSGTPAARADKGRPASRVRARSGRFALEGLRAQYGSANPNPLRVVSRRQRLVFHRPLEGASPRCRGLPLGGPVRCGSSD